VDVFLLVSSRWRRAPALLLGRGRGVMEAAVTRARRWDGNGDRRMIVSEQD
jgi:hypothetical protein